MTVTNVKQRVLWEHMNCTHWTHMGSILFYGIYVHGAVLDISISEFVHIYPSMFEASLVSNYMFSCQNWIETSHPKLSLLYFSLQSWFLHVNFVDVLVCFFSSVIMVINYPCAVRFFRAAAQPWILVHSILEKCYNLLLGCVQYVHLQSPWIHYIFA